MVFNSMSFLMFFPIVFFLYFLIPKKFRYIWLLVASYYFYMSWNAKYALLLLFSTFSTYICGLLVDKFNENDGNTKVKKILPMVVCIVVNLSILFMFKYFNFSMDILQRAMGKFDIQVSVPTFDVILPVGISFYTFQALGYIIDVYRKNVRAEKNPLKYALFVSFFPQLVAGPIERSKNLLEQIKKTTIFNRENARKGLVTMAYGLILKVVISDNIAVLINPIFDSYGSQRGATIVIATVLFAFQIYCDFHGYTQIAIGSAKVLGYDLMENFDAPYFSKSIKEFWKRWHKSLTTWFTDYLYIPLGGNRKGKIRKHVNTMIVFLVSGLWHGASVHYVVWGGLNGMYMVVSDSTKNIRDKIKELLHIDENLIGYKIFRLVFTFFIVDLSWLFFRANGFRDALSMIKIIINDFDISFLFSNEIFNIFVDIRTFFIIMVGLSFILTVDYLKTKGMNWIDGLLKQQLIVRWIVYFIIVFCIIIFGAYGEGYEQTQFIYFQF